MDQKRRQQRFNKWINNTEGKRMPFQNLGWSISGRPDGSTGRGENPRGGTRTSKSRQNLAKSSKHGKKSWARAGQELNHGIWHAVPEGAADRLRAFRRACLTENQDSRRRRLFDPGGRPWGGYGHHVFQLCFGRVLSFAASQPDGWSNRSLSSGVLAGA